MKFKFIKPEELDRNLKATVHRTGKLGFTVEAAKKLKLAADMGMMIALNDEDENDKNLYVIVTHKHNGDSFRVSKAGGYFYVSTKDLFDNLGVDYVSDTAVYDIRTYQIDGKDGFIFKRRLSKQEMIQEVEKENSENDK